MPRPRPLLRAAAPAAAALVLVGCAGGETTSRPAAPSASPTGAEPTTTDAVDPTPSALPTGVPGEPEDVATGLPVPWDVVPMPDGSALVSLRDEARVVRVTPDGDVVDVPATGEGGRVPGVAPRGEGGLLGLALLADGTTTWLYAYLTTAEDNRVVRMAFDGRSLGAPEDVLTGIPAAEVHNGGRIAFGPDGMLYVATGDARDVERAPDPDDLAGKVLRTTPEGDPAPGNPDPGSPVLTRGHRNVQGLGWDADGRLYASEFGQDRLDELNLLQPGGDYGWPAVEGGGGAPEHVDPLVTWSTDEASPSGLAVTGDAVYLAALRGERLWRVPLDGAGGTGSPEAFLTGELGRLRDVEVAPDGRSLWVVTNNTARGEPRDGDDRLVRVPLG